MELNKQFLERADMLKQSYYENVVDDLKTSNIGEWYSKIKRMSQIDQKEAEMEVPSKELAAMAITYAKEMEKIV